MNKNVFILVIVLCTLAPLATICQTDNASEEGAIKKAALDYIDYFLPVNNLNNLQKIGRTLSKVMAN